MYSGDFVRLTTAHSGVNGVEPDKINGDTTAEGVAPKEEDDWTDAEVLLLLEGIEMYDDDWVAVSEHVGTRSREACVVKFLQLPIDEGYHDLEAGVAASTSASGGPRPPSGTNREGDLGILRFGKIPFEKSDNPVLSVVAFLAGVHGLENIGVGTGVQEAGKDVPEMKKEADDIVMDGADGTTTSTNGEAMPPTSRVRVRDPSSGCASVEFWFRVRCNHKSEGGPAPPAGAARCIARALAHGAVGLGAPGPNKHRAGHDAAEAGAGPAGEARAEDGGV
jgi:SWI/SNF related-matrix-associated actin-dependent regulator of chromatin subfamily C